MTFLMRTLTMQHFLSKTIRSIIKIFGLVFLLSILGALAFGRRDQLSAPEC